MKHAADSLFGMNPEHSAFVEGAVLLRGEKKKEERFDFRTATREEEVVSACPMKIRSAMNRKRLSVNEARPNQSPEPTRLRRSFLFAHAARLASEFGVSRERIDRMISFEMLEKGWQKSTDADLTLRRY